MLTELSVQALGVIDRAEVSLTAGCSALTGETGAGKTLLVAAMGLLLGGRADRSLVREDAPEALVEGRFVLPSEHPAVVALAERGVVEPGAGDVEVVIGRTISADGRAKARVNGHLVPLSLVTEIAPRLVEIAGQHEHHRLASPGYQRALLDSYAGPETVELARRVRASVRSAAAARRDLEELRAGARERERELDVLRYEANEITSVDLQPGESDRLLEEARRLENAGDRARAVDHALALLEGEGGASDALAAAARLLDGLSGEAAFAALARRLEAAAIEATDVAGELAALNDVPDPERLDEVRARRDAIARLRRKYGDDDAEILAYLERARTRIAELEQVDEGLSRRDKDVHDAETTAASLAADLRARRVAAAERLGDELVATLEGLSLGGARVRIEVNEVELFEGGIDDVRFLVSLNPGEGLRPLAKVASGGELSRLSLALSLLTSTGEAQTIVFDEVDAGVGGATAHSVGRALASVASRNGVQVLVVTHLPQVAAFADHQFRVRKLVSDGRTASVVEPIEGDDRVDELSRMLAGMPESTRAREHAQELLELAARS